MKTRLEKGVEAYRVRTGARASTKHDGPNGHFQFRRLDRTLLQVIVSDGYGWDHASVVAFTGSQARLPTYDEMDFVKRAFWDDSECVMQLHVPRTEHISHHDHCLHLWRPQFAEIPCPHPLMVGPIKGEPLPDSLEAFNVRILADMPHLAPYIVVPE